MLWLEDVVESIFHETLHHLVEDAQQCNQVSSPWPSGDRRLVLGPEQLGQLSTQWGECPPQASVETVGIG